jgi:hypothetical protein
MLSRKVCLGAEDYDAVKRQLEQAKDAGVLETGGGYIGSFSPALVLAGRCARGERIL